MLLLMLVSFGLIMWKGNGRGRVKGDGREQGNRRGQTSILCPYSRPPPMGFHTLNLRHDGARKSLLRRDECLKFANGVEPPLFVRDAPEGDNHPKDAPRALGVCRLGEGLCSHLEMLLTTIWGRCTDTVLVGVPGTAAKRLVMGDGLVLGPEVGLNPLRDIAATDARVCLLRHLAVTDVT